MSYYFYWNIFKYIRTKICRNYDITQRTLPIFAYGNITKTNSFTNNNNGLFKFPEFNREPSATD